MLMLLADLRAYPLQLERCNALLLDVSYTPVGILGWQRAVLMSLFDKVRRCVVLALLLTLLWCPLFDRQRCWSTMM